MTNDKKQEATEAKAEVEKIIESMDKEISTLMQACIDQNNVALFTEAFKNTIIKE